ncbi:phosphoenolpyruvate carboxylase kinase 2-like protein [Tanacetum coccineum]
MPDLFDRISKRYCHRLRIAHQDIKHDNVLFDNRGMLKLVDFGFAEWFGMSKSGTMSGVVGTPYYVAPEVLSGLEYDEKCDVWSAGVILYIMLVGCYTSTTAETQGVMED